MAVDFSKLKKKVENGGSSDEGRLTAQEWNDFVEVVEKNQNAVRGVIKGIDYNGTLYNEVTDGILKMTVLGDTGRKSKFEWIQQPEEPNNTIAKGGSCVVEFNVIDQIQDEDDSSKLVSYNQPGTVTFYVDGKQVGRVTNVYDSGNSKYTGPVKFDFGKATNLSTKTEGNVLRVVYENTGVVMDKYFTVYVLDLSVRVLNFQQVYTTDNKTNVDVEARGANCKVYVQVDDVMVVDGEETRDGIPFNVDEDRFIDKGVNTHGVHTLKVWASPTNFEGVRTDTITYNYIFGNTTSDAPIVMTTIADGSEYEVYGRLNVDYTTFFAGYQGSKNITIKLMDGNKELLGTTQSVSFTDGVGTGSYTFTIFPQGNVKEEDFIGNDRNLVISITGDDGTEHKHITNIVILSSTVPLGQAEGWAVYLSSIGRNNMEPEYENGKKKLKAWTSVSDDKDQTVVDVTFDDSIEFIDSGSGWCPDGIKTNPNDPEDKGTVAMHLQKGKGFTLNYKPFLKNPTYNSGSNNGSGKGLTISIEFATRNCLDANAKVIECMDYSQEETGRGFYVTASEAKLLANDIELGAKFRENTRIKLDLVIEKELTKYYYDTVVGTDPTASDYVQKGESDECLALMFIDGVYVGITLIGKDTTFQHSYGQEKPIRFGSEDCDLDVYSIRIYNRPLTVNEIVQNYSWDTPILSEKVAIAQRNDIFATATNNRPTIDIGKLRKARPDLPFFYVDLDSQYNDVLPQDKSAWKLCSTTVFDNPNATSGDKDEPLTTFEAVTGVLRNQGTSSMTYPWPWRNWDWKSGDEDFESDKDKYLFYLPDATNTSETTKKWHQFPYTGTGSNLPIKKITLKKDYASSEMCNNAICSEIFTDMAVGIGTARPNVLSPAMRSDIESKKTTDFRLSLKAQPCFMFHRLDDPNKDGSAGAGIDAMGMMNLIPNKNEVGYLGFSANKWEDAKDNVTAREQSWELCDNLDDIFWVKKFDYFQKTATGFKNDVKDHYEARTPKDTSVSGWDADFGMTPKSATTVTAQEAAVVRDESKDIVEFHNWCVDVNQFLATGNPLTGAVENWNRDENGNRIYDTDSKEYRKAKFAAEAENRLILDQWILYYIWREQFWMFDSGFKNLQVYTVGPNPATPSSSIMQWGCMVRDADTGLGIENTGKDYFPPHIEDVDYYTEENGVITFHYDGAKDIYDITELEQKRGKNAKAVLNGQFGSIWVNIRDVYPDRIATMYRLLVDNAGKTHFGAEPAINKFRGHQEHWCESLYNFGMRQYFGGSPFSYFNKSALGDKKNSRAQWLERGFYYRSGKYRKLSDGSAFRINTYSSPQTDFAKELNVKAYIPMYIGCGGTTAEMINSKNVIRLLPNTYADGSVGKPVSVGEEGFNFPNSGDAVSYVYGTSMLTDIGDLARVCKILRVQNMNFPKLREFNLGHESARDGVVYQEYATAYIYDETTGEWIVDESKPLGEPREFRNEILPELDCSSMTQLTLLDVTNHTNLSKLTINKCRQLKKLYARGTVMQSIDFPTTTSLETIYLGNALKTLELKNLTGIKEFVIEGLANCGRLHIENCGSYMAVESFNLMKMAIDKLESSYNPHNNPNVCTLRGVDWNITEDNGYVYLERLLAMNTNLTGKIKVKQLPNDLKVKLINGYIAEDGTRRNGYGNIDDPNNSLYIEYIQEAIQNVTMPSKIYIYEEGETSLSFIVTPATANTYKSAKWELSPNSYATISNPSMGIISRNDKEATESEYATLTVTISQMNESDGTERDDIVITSRVYFYERIAKPGDIVFNDGTYSDENDISKTPIGVCFYVDPTDKTRRLMCALEPLKFNNSRSMDWGPTKGNDYGEGASQQYYGAANSLDVPDLSYMQGSTLINKDCYNLNTIQDVNSPGEGLDSSITNFYKDDIYRDSESPSNGFFKPFEKGYIYGEIGWKNAFKSVKVDKLGDDETESISIAMNERVPIGYYNTIAIIQQRNKLLDWYKDTQNQEGAFHRPKANEDYSELKVLEQLTQSANSWKYAERTTVLIGGTRGELLYCPAASACFAYEPSGVSNLDDRFKKHKWFLPASGDLMRILYYVYQSYNGGVVLDEPFDSSYNSSSGTPANAFKNVMNIKNSSNQSIFKANLFTSYFFSSTEASDDSAVAITANTGAYSNRSKSTSASVIPVCMF